MQLSAATPCDRIRSFGLESETTTDDPYLVLRRILIPFPPLVPSDLIPLLLHLPGPAGLANRCQATGTRARVPFSHLRFCRRLSRFSVCDSGQAGRANSRWGQMATLSAMTTGGGVAPSNPYQQHPGCRGTPRRFLLLLPNAVCTSPVSHTLASASICKLMEQDPPAKLAEKAPPDARPQKRPKRDYNGSIGRSNRQHPNLHASVDGLTDNPRTLELIAMRLFNPLFMQRLLRASHPYRVGTRMRRSGFPFFPSLSLFPCLSAICDTDIGVALGRSQTDTMHALAQTAI